jgi:hypothetical protein
VPIIPTAFDAVTARAAVAMKVNRVGCEVMRHLRAHEEIKTHVLEVLPVSLLVAKAS